MPENHTAPRRWLPWAFLVLAGTATIAFARFAPNASPSDVATHPRMEFVNQDVQADVVVKTLNDLEAQGWEVFQIIPIWKLQNEGDSNGLVASSYQVFGRRPVK